MATPTIDITFLEYFSPIFVFVLVVLIVYAMFYFTKFMGSNKTIHWAIAAIVGIVFMFSTKATTVVTVLAPWFTVFFIFLVFLIMAYKLFGATDDQIKNVISHSHAIQYGVFTIGIIIVLFALGAGFGQDLLGYTQDVGEAVDTSGREAGTGSTATSDYTQNLIATLFNTRILGMILILAVASLTIRAMSAPLRPDWP